MDNRIWVAALAMAAATLQCKSATPERPAETAGELTPAALFHPEDQTPAAEPAEPVTEPILPEPSDDMLYELDQDEARRCPLAQSGVTMTAEDAPNGIMFVFRTDGDGDETESVRELTRRFYDDLMRSPKPAFPG